MTTVELTPRKNLWKFLIPVFAILALIVGSLLFIRHRVAQSPSIVQPGEQALLTLRVGNSIPDLVIQEFNGSRRKISSLDKKVLLVNFWATWCEPCLTEMPSIIRLRNAFKDKGFDVVAVNVDDKPETVVPKALRQIGIDFTVYTDPNEQLRDLFNIRGVPLSILLDRNRKILMIHDGERDWNNHETRALIERWLAG